jgi:putative exosortase-associated protein (TIGR04073 family)
VKLKDYVLTAGLFFYFASAASATDTSFSGNYAIPETQSGFLQENYEVQAGRKFQRGAENAFLSPLEIPQGVKSQYAKRRAEYLPVGIESFVVGVVRGFGNGFKRFGVGLYEMFTFVYPQEPILPEFDEWLY